MEDTIFAKIIRREASAEVLYEDEHTIAILNKFPNIEGETLIITKKQVAYVFALDEETYTHLMNTTRKIATALDTAFQTLRTCVVVEGFDVPHVHVRLYPVREKNLNLSHGPEASDEELKVVGAKIRPHIVHD